MATMHHGRDQVAYVRMGAKRDVGTITAFHTKIIADLGAYHLLLTPMIPELGAFVMTGCYAIPNVQTNITGVLTNTYMTDAIRGAGRPEMTHMLEVTIELLAQKLGMDPLEVRRKNFIRADQFPYTTPYGITYDSGDYAGALDRALEMLDVAASAPSRRLRERRLRGVGFSTYTEVCGVRPVAGRRPEGFGSGRPDESALVRVHPNGTVTVYTGTLAARPGPRDRLRADRRRPARRSTPSEVEVIYGDTATRPRRASARTARARWPSAARRGARGREGRARRPGDRRAPTRGGARRRRGRPTAGSRSGRAGQGDDARRDRGRAYIAATCPRAWSRASRRRASTTRTNFVFPFGTHICVVDVDADTGKVEIVRYVAVDDCGPAINPMLIDGQVHGGVAHAHRPGAVRAGRLRRRRASS